MESNTIPWRAVFGGFEGLLEWYYDSTTVSFKVFSAYTNGVIANCLISYTGNSPETIAGIVLLKSDASVGIGNASQSWISRRVVARQNQVPLTPDFGTLPP